MIDPTRLAEFVETQPPSTGASGNRSRVGIAASPETLRDYLEAHGVTIRELKPGKNGSTTLILSGCPMNPDHGHGTDTAVIWRPNGIGFSCKHDGCAGYKWSDVRAKIDPDGNAQQRSGGDKQAAQIVELASKVEFFNADDAAYATVQVGTHHETHPVRSMTFKRWLMREFYQLTKKPPTPEALTSALGVLEARGLFDGPQLKVAVRLADFEG